MKQALNSRVIFEQKSSLDAIEKCINYHYEFREEDEKEMRFRETLKKAREDLLQAEEEIKRMVHEEQQKTSSKT